ncbi:hypothetical protein HDU98_000337 [Podochytrium sp. JEL0797]|nr:hypothetical protein HDU98_000337 [Podochytrium sp. JEL0797]
MSRPSPLTSRSNATTATTPPFPSTPIPRTPTAPRPTTPRTILSIRNISTPPPSSTPPTAFVTSGIHSNYILASQTPSTTHTNIYTPSPPYTPHHHHRLTSSSSSQSSSTSMPPLTPTSPSTTRLAAVLTSITTLETRERQYRAEVDSFRRALALVERLIDATEEMSTGLDDGTFESEHPFGRPAGAGADAESEAFTTRGGGVMDLEEMVGGFTASTRLFLDGVYREIEEHDSGQRLQMQRPILRHNPELESDQEEEEEDEDEILRYDLPGGMSRRAEHRMQLDDESDEEMGMDRFNSTMSALRLIYANRRLHGHVRGPMDYEEEEESDDDAVHMAGTRNGAPLFFEDGVASNLENWLTTRPILDANGALITDVSLAIEHGVGFETPEGNGGTEMLWRGYDDNGNVRLDANGEEYVEIIEVTNSDSSFSCGTVGCRDCAPRSNEDASATVAYSGMRAGLLARASLSERTRAACVASREVWR